MAYVKAQLSVPQIEDVNGNPAAGYTISSYIWDTATPTPMYTSSAGAGSATSFALNSLGQPQTAGGTAVDIFLDSAIVYKFIITDAGGTPVGPTIGPVYAGNADASEVTANGATTARPLSEYFSDFPVVLNFGAGTNITTALQAAIDAYAGPITIYIPAGASWTITSTIYLRRNGVKIRGAGIGTTTITYNNAAGGTAFDGTTNGTDVITDCELSGFSLYGDVTTGFSVGVDLVNFSYSKFDLSVQTRRPNGICYSGVGNTGSQPYYNEIKGYLFGGSDRTQTGIYFGAGIWSGGSPGPNANKIGPIYRAASLGILCDIEAGNGNMFADISAESINDYYFRLNNVLSYSDTGTSTGSNGPVTLNNTGKSYTTNQFVNYGIRITGGTGAGQSRIIKSNSATVITVEYPWAVVPDATSTYVIASNRAHSNKFVNIRGEGLSSDNPDFIYALPGTYDNKFTNCVVDSLGSGLWARDESGAVNNKWFDGDKIVITETVTNPGASANIDIYPRNSVYGGVMLSNYSIEWMSVTINAASPGDTATVRLDVGGTSAGTGSDMTITAVTSGDLAFAMPTNVQKLERDATNRHVFLNLQTGASFSGTADVIITWCATIDM